MEQEIEKRVLKVAREQQDVLTEQSGIESSLTLIVFRNLYGIRASHQEIFSVKNNIKKYIYKRLPEEYEKCLVGLNAIVKEAWNTSE